MSRTRSRASNLFRSITGADEEDQQRLEEMISRNQDGVEKVLSRNTEGYGAMGPVEQPIDLEKVVTVPDPDSTFNENDPWKYPIDVNTQMRLVEFKEDDPDNPKSWSVSYKWWQTCLLGLLCFDVALGSAIVTGDIEGPMETFGVSEEVIILTITVFVLGFGFGPLVFAPLSEEIGRYPVYAVTLAFAVIFIIPCAVAQNIGTLIVCRLIDGLAFSAPMTVIGGSLADMWTVDQRGVAMSIFSMAPFLGPVIGPLIGGYIGDNAGWRWLYWVLLIFSFCIFVAIAAFCPETHHGTLLKRRAKKLRKLTGDDRYRSLTELKVRNTKQLFEDTLLRPFVLLSELIVFLITVYMSVIYGLLYMFFFAYPVVYMEGKHWSASKTGLMFIPIAVGVIVSTAISPFFNRDYNKRAAKYVERGEMAPPELRLIPMMIGCWFVPVGLFCYAWTTYPTLSWAGPCISGFACGFGFLSLYNPANNYIVDSYQHYAASGIAAKTFLRSIWGACVPLFTIQMYHRLGYQWATSLMAFISLACCAIPYGFYFFGARIRKRSKYAYSPNAAEVGLEKEKSESSSDR